MIRENEVNCPYCGGDLRYYDRVQRIVRTRYSKVYYIWLRRFKCDDCSSMHRELPEILLPYKHYEREVIFGVIEGFITPETLGFEDYPCEATMIQWISQSSNKTV